MIRVIRYMAFVFVLALAGSASALSITGIAVAPTAANSPNQLTNIGANRRQVASATSITASSPGPVADVLGASVGFDSRYAFLLAADRDFAVASSTSRSATSEYTVSFTVNNPSGAAYQLDVDTSLLGALVLVDDGSGNASATLGPVVGLLDGSGDPTLDLAAPPALSASGGAYQAVSASNTLTLVETALARSYVLTFTFSSSVTSARDEAAILLGIAGALSSSTADDYPGVGGRTAANDGHLVSVNATLIPEPAAGLLMLLPGALVGRRLLR